MEVGVGVGVVMVEVDMLVVQGLEDDSVGSFDSSWLVVIDRKSA